MYKEMERQKTQIFKKADPKYEEDKGNKSQGSDKVIGHTLTLPKPRAFPSTSMKEQAKGQDQKTSTQTELWNLSQEKVSANVVPQALATPGSLPQKEVTKEEIRSDQTLNRQPPTKMTKRGGTSRLRKEGHQAKDQKG